MPEDFEIIELYWARDELALLESERKYGEFCMRISMNILSYRQDADECVLDTWHRSWNAMPPARPDSLRAFFGRIVRNLSLSRYRREHAHKRFCGMNELLSELDECIPSKEDVEQAVEASELTRVIEEWLSSLCADDRALFLRRYWNGDALSALARECGVSANSLGQRMFRLRSSLREALIKEDITI